MPRIVSLSLLTQGVTYHHNCLPSAKFTDLKYLVLLPPQSIKKRKRIPTLHPPRRPRPLKKRKKKKTRRKILRTKRLHHHPPKRIRRHTIPKKSHLPPLHLLCPPHHPQKKKRHTTQKSVHHLHRHLRFRMMLHRLLQRAWIRQGKMGDQMKWLSKPLLMLRLSRSRQARVLSLLGMPQVGT